MASATVYQCNSCGGFYRPIQADGMVYFHVCPDVKVIVGADVDAQGKTIVPATTQAIANPRNENVKIDATGKATVKAGDPNGFTVVTDPKILQPLGLG